MGTGRSTGTREEDCEPGMGDMSIGTEQATEQATDQVLAATDTAALTDTAAVTEPVATEKDAGSCSSVVDA